MATPTGVLDKVNGKLDDVGRVTATSDAASFIYGSWNLSNAEAQQVVPVLQALSPAAAAAFSSVSSGGESGSAVTFEDAWRQAAAAAPKEFLEAQRTTVRQLRYEPAEAAIRAAGIDLAGQPTAVKETLWSFVLLFGPEKLPTLYTDAARLSYISNDGLVNAENRRVFTEKLYDMVTGEDWVDSRSPEAVGILNRLALEKQEAVNLLQKEETAASTTLQSAQTKAGAAADDYDADFANKVMAAAEKYVGKIPYRAGGDGEKFIDAGMLVKKVLLDVKLDVGTSVVDEIYKLAINGKKIFTDISKVKKGDLVFFAPLGEKMKVAVSVANHVAFYSGEEKKVLHAHSSCNVAYSNLTDEFVNAILGYCHLTPRGFALLGSDKAAQKSGSATKFQAPPSDVGVRIEGKYTVVKVQPDKTYCEPVYPDMCVFPGGVLPDGSVDFSKIRKEDVTIKPGMIMEITTEKLKDLYGVDLSGLVAPKDAITERQRDTDFRKYRKRIKPFSKGMPMNIRDPFPVDAKIMEIEMHRPRVKQPKIKLSEIKNAHGSPCAAGIKNDLTIAAHVLEAAHRTEQRLVKLENNMATIMRHLWRLGSRISINCVYYGGQDVGQKYRSIRCMHDDRVRDGGLMSLDQCNHCTRYEPIYGKTYEILNDVGLNLDMLLDECQLGYSTMDEKVRQLRNDEMPVEKPRAKLNTDLNRVRTANDIPMAVTWPEGMKMNWSPTPVELQKPLVVLEQDINGTKIAQLASSQIGNTKTSGSSLKAGNMLSIMKQNRDALLKMVSEGHCVDWFDKEVFGNNAAATFTENMKNIGYENALRQLCTEKEIDPVLVAAVAAIETGGVPSDGDYAGVMQVERDKIYQDSPNYDSLPELERCMVGFKLGIEGIFQKQSAVETTNPALSLSAYNGGEGYQIGTPSGAVRLDQTPSGIQAGLNWDERDSWLYTTMSAAYWDNIQKMPPNWDREEKITYFAKVCFAYCKIAESFAVGCSIEGEFRGTKLNFCFADDTIKNNEIIYTSSFGGRTGKGSVGKHAGVDFACNEGTPVVAICDGIVCSSHGEDVNGYGEQVCVQHGMGSDAFYYRVAHLSERKVNEGDTVLQGQVLGYTGNTGGSSGPHLHFEILTDAMLVASGGQAHDPLDDYRTITNIELPSRITLPS